MRVPPSLYSWEAQAKRPLLNSILAGIAVLILMPIGMHWIAGESWAFSISVGVLCSIFIFFFAYRRLNPEKDQPPLPPWIEQSSAEDD
jgi:hypothetical protein